MGQSLLERGGGQGNNDDHMRVELDRVKKDTKDILKAAENLEKEV